MKKERPLRNDGEFEELVAGEELADKQLGQEWNEWRVHPLAAGGQQREDSVVAAANTSCMRAQRCSRRHGMQGRRRRVTKHPLACSWCPPRPPPALWPSRAPAVERGHRRTSGRKGAMCMQPVAWPWAQSSQVANNQHSRVITAPCPPYLEQRKRRALALVPAKTSMPMVRGPQMRQLTQRMECNIDANAPCQPSSPPETTMRCGQHKGCTQTPGAYPSR